MIEIGNFRLKNDSSLKKKVKNDSKSPIFNG